MEVCVEGRDGATDGREGEQMLLYESLNPGTAVTFSQMTPIFQNGGCLFPDILKQRGSFPLFGQDPAYRLGHRLAIFLLFVRSELKQLADISISPYVILNKIGKKTTILWYNLVEIVYNIKVNIFGFWTLSLTKQDNCGRHLGI